MHNRNDNDFLSQDTIDIEVIYRINLSPDRIGLTSVLC